MWWYSALVEPAARLELGHQRRRAPRARPSARTPGRAGAGGRCAPARRPGARPARPRSGGVAARRRTRWPARPTKPICSATRATRSSRTGSSAKAAGPTSLRRRAARSPRPSCGSMRAPGASTGTAIALTVTSRRDRSSSIVAALERRDVDLRLEGAALHAPGAERARQAEARGAVRPAERGGGGRGVARRRPRPGRSPGAPSARRAPRPPPPRPAPASGASGAISGVRSGGAHPWWTRGTRGPTAHVTS